MKGYFVSTTALICLLILSMYYSARNISVADNCHNKDLKQSHISSVIALDKKAAEENVPIQMVNAVKPLDAQVLCHHKLYPENKYQEYYNPAINKPRPEWRQHEQTASIWNMIFYPTQGQIAMMRSKFFDSNWKREGL